MKRSDFRIIKVDKFDGRDTKTTYRLQKKLFFFFWYNLTEQNSVGYVESIIHDLIRRDEDYNKRKTTKTIVG